MDVSVDRNKCRGYGLCHGVAPEVFDLDDAGYVELLKATVEPDLENQVRQAIKLCPEQAISSPG